MSAQSKYPELAAKFAYQMSANEDVQRFLAKKGGQLPNIVSMAEGGHLVRHLDEASMRKILHGIYNRESKEPRLNMPKLYLKGRRRPKHDEQQTDKKA